MNKPGPTNKILIVLPYWKGDQEPALKLARLISDLEPEKSTLADLLFVARFDCPINRAELDYVARKFIVYTHQSRRRGTGWPNGCNSLFFGSMEWVYHKMAAAQIPQYKAILNFAGDCVPLRKDWLSLFHASFDQNPAFVSGALIEGGPHRTHINGDCTLLSGDLKFLKWLVGTSEPGGAGWDYSLAEEFKRWGWADLPYVKSLWNFTAQFTEEQWQSEKNHGTAVIHGVKNYSLQNLARKHLL
jgi:hypothetical protein